MFAGLQGFIFNTFPVKLFISIHDINHVTKLLYLLAAMLFNLNVYPFEVVSRYRDTQLHMNENY